MNSFSKPRNFGHMLFSTETVDLNHLLKMNGFVLYYYQNIQIKNFEKTMWDFQKLSQIEKENYENKALHSDEKEYQHQIPKFIKIFSCKCLQKSKNCSTCGGFSWTRESLRKCRNWFKENLRNSWVDYNIFKWAEEAWKREKKFQLEVETLQKSFQRFLSSGSIFELKLMMNMENAQFELLKPISFEKNEAVGGGFNSNSEFSTKDSFSFGLAMGDGPRKKEILEEIEGISNSSSIEFTPGAFSFDFTKDQNSFGNQSPKWNDQNGNQEWFREKSFELKEPLKMAEEFNFSSNSSVKMFGSGEESASSEFTFGSNQKSFKQTLKREITWSFEYRTGLHNVLPQIFINNVRLTYPLEDHVFERLLNTSCDKVTFASNFNFDFLKEILSKKMFSDSHHLEFSHVQIYGKENKNHQKPRKFQKNHVGYFHVYLPSIYSGGEFKLKFSGREPKFDFTLRDSDFLNFHWIAFHDHCEVERSPVTSGNQILLVYDIFQSKPEYFRYFSELKEQYFVPFALEYMDFIDIDSYNFSFDQTFDGRNFNRNEFRIYSQLMDFSGWNVKIISEKILQYLPKFQNSLGIVLSNNYSSRSEISIFVTLKKKLKIENFKDLKINFRSY
jgi:hypothetical protein